VGYVNSSSFIANSERGPSSIGGGRLDGFFVVPKSAFALPNFSTATISFSSLTNKKTTSQEYKDEVKNKINEIENVLDDNNFIVNNQTSDPGYGDYEGLSSRIDLIGNVFPVFFFFIAGLITFTAMVRFVEENRQEIGTLKSLGYKNREIFRKYVIFSLFVAAVGLLGGILIGTYLLPLAVFSMLEGQYIFTNYTTSFYVWPIVISVAATIIVTLGASIISLWGTLKEKPTSLLAMKAPKMGKSVFLERFPALWSKLNFNQKITYRNIARYKSRMV
jgi:putative ABC transport system permease protein